MKVTSQLTFGNAVRRRKSEVKMWWKKQKIPQKITLVTFTK
jgi:hypothetical protein